MLENNIYKKAFAMLCWAIASMLLMRVTNGAYGIVIVALGVLFALSNKIGWAMCHYALLMMMVVINPILLPKTGQLWALSLRAGPLLIGLSLIVSASRAYGQHRIPLGGMFPFLLVACISASIGWVPQISYLKLLSFVVFFFGIWLGTQNIQHKIQDVILIRAMLLAIVVFFIVGSLALLPFPHISYLSSLRAYGEGGAEAAADAAFQMQELVKSGMAGGYSVLFCGITNQSQALAPIVSLCFAWVTCDMIFIEKRMRWPHISLMVLAIPLLYLTRSRVAILTLVSSLVVIYFYAMNKIRVFPEVRAVIKKGMFLFGFLLILVAVVAELNNQTVSKWLRKSNDIEGDCRDFSEAFTQSRMGLVEQSMYEFERSPMFGSGFQVSEAHVSLMQHSDGLILSAPIEKGLLPVMVLGETGVVGAICFGFFLVSFFVVATRRRLYVTISMFIILFMSNFGEATFFSLGGMGGTLWVLSIVGGFIIDTIVLREQGYI